LSFPSPQTVDILAEVSDYLGKREHIGEFPPVMRSLAQFAGNGGTQFVTVADEREAMVNLAAQAVARIEILDQRKDKV